MTDTSSAVPSGRNLVQPGAMTALMSSWLRSRSALGMRVVNMMTVHRTGAGAALRKTPRPREPADDRSASGTSRRPS